MAGRRHRGFWVAAGTILLMIGGLLVAKALAFDPKDVQVEFQAKFTEVQNLPESEILKKDAMLEELLRNDSYKDHAKALYREVDRTHSKVHEPAMLELEAKK